MSVSDGQQASASVFNAAFMSRDSDTSTTGIVALNHASSGGTIANAQQQINTNTGDIATHETRLDTAEADITTLESDVTTIQSKVSAGFGAGASTSETTFLIVNNQSSAADITGLVASGAYYITRVKYWVRRVGDVAVMEAGEMIIMFDGTDYSMGAIRVETATTAGMSFDINSATGQVTYTSSNMSNYVGSQSKIGWVISTQGTI